MPATITEVLGNAGAPLEFQSGDATYTVSKLTQKLKARYEQWLNANLIEIEEANLRVALKRWQAATGAVADLTKERDRVSSAYADAAKKNGEPVDNEPMVRAVAALAFAEAMASEEEAMLEEARRSMRQSKDGIAAGESRFGGPLWMKSIRTPAGVIKLTALLLEVSEEKAFELFADDGDKLAGLVELSVRQSLPKSLAAASGASPTA